MLIFNFLFTLAAALPAPSSSASSTGASFSSSSSSTDDTYIVVFEKGIQTPGYVVQSVAETLKNLGATINWEYHTVIRGFSVSGSKNIMDKLATTSDPRYPFIIEKDQQVTINTP